MLNALPNPSKNLLSSLFARWARLLRNKGGVAVSLLEATATLAVGATLLGAAIGTVSDKTEQAHIATTDDDVKTIGDAINNFENDTGFYPIFKSAGTLNRLTGPDPDAVQGSNTTASSSSRSNVDILQSATGDAPKVGGEADNARDEFNEVGHPGHQQPSSQAGWGSTNFDTIENQLTENAPGYVRLGFSFDRNRGWNGPYLATVPPQDGWGNKFKVNAMYLDDHRVSTGDTNPFMTFVLSAGPNETIDSLFEVTSRNLKDAVGGDDILFRIR